MPIALAVAVAIVLTVTIAVLRRRGSRDEVRGFQAARAITSRWAADPASAPPPIRKIAENGVPRPDDNQ